MNIQEKLGLYIPTRLKPDLTRLSENERNLLPLLIQAVDAMDVPYWIQEYGDPKPLLDSISNKDMQQYIQINFGPWDRMNGNKPIISGVGEKPLGGKFLPI